MLVLVMNAIKVIRTMCIYQNTELWNSTNLLFSEYEGLLPWW